MTESTDPGQPGTDAVLGRDAILKAEDRPTERVPVPEWGGVVLVRGMDGHERDRFETENIQLVAGKPYPNTEDARARLAARCIVGEDGKPLFGKDDVAALSARSGAALERVAEVAARLSGLNEALEAMAGNSAAAPGGDSSSSSPATSATPRPGRSSRKSTRST